MKGESAGPGLQKTCRRKVVASKEVMEKENKSVFLGRAKCI
jgi:hypothetical protein